MSAADFPWLAEHRVQYTPVMPAAGYVEMILEALGGPPVHFEVVRFLKPCLLSGDPVRLQTELEPVPGPGETYRFLICSVPLRGSAESVLHCTGQVSRIMPNGAGGSALSALDRSRFADAGLGSREAFYGQLNAVIGEYVQYGPRFQAVHEVRGDLRTGELLLELALDDALWHDGRRAGYLLPPPLLNGGLQAFLYYLMQCPDVSAVPRRMEGLTVSRQARQAEQRQAELHRAELHRAELHRAEPRHRYSLARYGLTAPQVDAAFARYAEFVRGNKIRLE